MPERLGEGGIHALHLLFLGMGRSKLRLAMWSPLKCSILFCFVLFIYFTFYGSQVRRKDGELYVMKVRTVHTSR